MLARQQQARLQIGEPRGHDEIVSREFDADPPGAVDEEQILFGERQHGNAGEIDFLVAGEEEQQIERPLPPVKLQIERRIIARPGTCSPV